jgi:hypothetical protein
MTTTDTLLLVIHCVATCMMAGIIWFVQIVHYPLLAEVGPESAVRYENENTRRTTYVVGPPMLVEAGTALAILIFGVPGVPAGLAVAGVALVAINTLSTALLQVPAHTALSAGFDAGTVRRLVATNWVRTAAWTARAAVAAAMIIVAVPSPHAG